MAHSSPLSVDSNEVIISISSATNCPSRRTIGRWEPSYRGATSLKSWLLPIGWHSDVRRPLAGYKALVNNVSGLSRNHISLSLSLSLSVSSTHTHTQWHNLHVPALGWRDGEIVVYGFEWGAGRTGGPAIARVGECPAGY